MNVSLRRTQRGVSLIELMLALAIIAIILVIATRYFARANLSQQVSNATDQVMGVRAATNSYLGDKAGSGATITLSIGNLVTTGYLPESYKGTSGTAGNGVNPWNGNISVSTASGKYTITTTDVPAAACDLLKEKLAGNANSGLGESVGGTCTTTTAGSVTATFTR